MVTDKIQQIETFKKRITALEKQVEKQLSELHIKYGFSTVDDFVAAVKNVNSKDPGKNSGCKRNRTIITPALKQKVVEALKAGRTGEEVAETSGISLPSVYNIKKAVGLTKARTKG